MSDRIPCKTPGCSGMILPETASKTQGFCMPCVQANWKQKQDEAVLKNRRTINAFDGIKDPVEVLKIVHQPRNYDPLVNWTPHPSPTDELYSSLSANGARRMADYAQKLIGTDRNDEAQDICLCLAAFTNANLDGCLRRLVTHNLLWPSLPFHRSPPDVRDELLERIEGNSVNHDHILSALAWIGDTIVIKRFDSWRSHPPRWSESLHIPPHDYSQVAGWELTNRGTRRNLYFTHCTSLKKGMSDNPSTFRIVSKRSDHCPWCSSKLTNLFEVEPPSDYSHNSKNWQSVIKIVTCEFCTTFGTVFGHLDTAGQAQWSQKNVRPDYLPANTSSWHGLPTDILHPAGERPAFFCADHQLPTTFSQLGGHPTWIQDRAYPICPDCSASMMFLAQIGCEDIDDADGIFYGFICPTCRVTATSYQQT